MGSVKIKFRPSSVENREGTIYYQIIHDRKVRQLPTEYRVLPSEWDEKKSMVCTNVNNERRPYILSVRERIRWDVERLNRIIRKLEAEELSFDAEDVINEFQRYAMEYSLFNFVEAAIVRLKQNSKFGTADNYRSALNSFRRFRQGEDIMLDNLTSNIMQDYEAWMRRSGNTPNTTSFYIRTIRAVYNRAIEEGIIENRNPFRRVYTGVEKTIKRAIPIDAIKRMMMLDLSLKPSLDFARDMFMLSFYLRGMSFIDMAFLRKSDLKNGCVTYRRSKTSQRLTIEWTVEMQAILDKYERNPTEFLLPILNNASVNLRNNYKSILHAINQHLKKIAPKIGLTIPLTMYVARHSWASAAKTKGIPISVISEGMGHDSEATTKIYLASLETSVVDKANSLILKSLR